MASFWMVVLTLLLSFMPLINGLVGGSVGGYLAGSLKRGLLAALLPALIVAILLWLLFVGFEAPILGLFSGLALGVIVLLADVGMLLGAAIGGHYAASRGESSRQPRGPMVTRPRHG